MMGIDFGTESARVGIFTLTGAPVIFRSCAYPLYHPRPGWAEQQPDEWWAALVTAVHQALADSGVAPAEIVGLSADTTCCTVVAMDAD
ncbi:MAG: xylulose kinase, partial [Caldilineaceae bacterium]|nr:xylulose kinase [Caldilineaceae bacterium]